MPDETTSWYEATRVAAPERGGLNFDLDVDVCVVGGGFAGIETIAELEDMARDLIKLNDRIDQKEARFVLVEAMGRSMPEVTAEQAEWVVEHLRSRGVEVLLNTSLNSAVDGNLELINMADKSPAGEFGADTLIWCAGVMANPMVRSTDFPIEQRGRIGEQLLPGRGELHRTGRTFQQGAAQFPFQ